MTVTAFALSTPLQGTSTDIEVQLVRAAQNGNEAAFERLYRRNVARMHTLATRMATPEAADDLTQEIFIRAWDKLPTFRNESSFSTWLFRLAVNVILGQRRSEKSERQWFTGEDTSLMEYSGASVPEGLKLDLEAAIARLPDGAREIFVLYDVEGWTHEEIAERLGLAIGTSKSQLSRARSALRGMLDVG